MIEYIYYDKYSSTNVGHDTGLLTGIQTMKVVGQRGMDMARNLSELHEHLRTLGGELAPSSPITDLKVVEDRLLVRQGTHHTK